MELEASPPSLYHASDIALNSIMSSNGSSMKSGNSNGNVGSRRRKVYKYQTFPSPNHFFFPFVFFLCSIDGSVSVREAVCNRAINSLFLGGLFVFIRLCRHTHTHTQNP